MVEEAGWGKRVCTGKKARGLGGWGADLLLQVSGAAENKGMSLLR